jgi:TPP-dependent indolepyruvate ferredoxin oxidoreductase alpha subunit
MTIEFKTFGEWLRHRRLQLEISPFRMAEVLGYKRVSAIYNFEYGIAPLPLSRWPTMAELLKLSMSDFLDIMNRFEPVKVKEFCTIRDSSKTGLVALPAEGLLSDSIVLDNSLEEGPNGQSRNSLEESDRFLEEELLEADYAIVADSAAFSIGRRLADSLKQQGHFKAGLLVLSASHPVHAPHLVETLKNARAILVLETRRQHLGSSDLLATQIKAAFADAWTQAEGFPKILHMPKIFLCLVETQLSENYQEELNEVIEALRSENGRRVIILGESQPVFLEKSKR